ncbi:hypothetical protein M9H77_02519 [Catharanthus roseus]|uniref:Uncharacterized protein n=1 Tax=Catharanthus roseus TaxID=4058 RepID=A0ACC0C8M2_CATRO|nr:hypothetical protein M9H77_02519 [Catharanthus roseus]
MEIDVIGKSKGVNLLTHETNFVLANDSLCMQYSWKQPEENVEARRRLMEFKGNFKNTKRKQSLCYEKVQMRDHKRALLQAVLWKGCGKLSKGAPRSLKRLKETSPDMFYVR